MVQQAETSGLGQYIKQRRRQLNLSRADLATQLTNNGYECTEGAINHWENGRAIPPLRDPMFARALAIALNAKPSDLLKASGYPLTDDTIQSVISRLSPITIQLLEKASPKIIKKADAILRTLLTDDE